MYNMIRYRLLESGEWLDVECSCDNWTICQNHHDMAERLDIDPLDLVGILAEIQEAE
jgi:hypothetical protein